MEATGSFEESEDSGLTPRSPPSTASPKGIADSSAPLRLMEGKEEEMQFHFGFLKASYKRGREALQQSRGTRCAMFPKRW